MVSVTAGDDVAAGVGEGVTDGDGEGVTEGEGVAPEVTRPVRVMPPLEATTTASCITVTGPEMTAAELPALKTTPLLEIPLPAMVRGLVIEAPLTLSAAPAAT